MCGSLVNSPWSVKIVDIMVYFARVMDEYHEILQTILLSHQ